MSTKQKGLDDFGVSTNQKNEKKFEHGLNWVCWLIWIWRTPPGTLSGPQCQVLLSGHKINIYCHVINTTFVHITRATHRISSTKMPSHIAPRDGTCVQSDGLFLGLTSLNITRLDHLSSRHNKLHYAIFFLCSPPAEADERCRVLGYKRREAHEGLTLIMQTGASKGRRWKQGVSPLRRTALSFLAQNYLSVFAQNLYFF